MATYFHKTQDGIDERRGIWEVNKMKTISQCRIYCCPGEDTKEGGKRPHLEARVVLDFLQAVDRTYKVQYSLTLIPKNVKARKGAGSKSMVLDTKIVEKLLKQDDGIIAQLIAKHESFVQGVIDETMPEQFRADAQSSALNEESLPGKPGQGSGRPRV